MTSNQIIDHLFRSEYGKMVSSLTRIFGVSNLEMVEDAVQDSFQKALTNWESNGIPDIPEAWLRTVAKNRVIDLLRKTNSAKEVDLKTMTGAHAIAINEVFSDHEIEDNQLRLLFTICHPSLKIQDQIIFALKTFSGFSRKEIASALLKSEENIKKSLTRARKNVFENNIAFEVPVASELLDRIKNVHLVLYLLFNEGFHSAGKDQLIRKDLVAEAMRLNELLITRYNDEISKALMAIMCFHAARIDSKVSENNQLILLEAQDRSKWNYNLILKGHQYMTEAVVSGNYSRFHWEAAIAGEYVSNSKFDDIAWDKLIIYYSNLLALVPSAINQLNLCAIYLQIGNLEQSSALFESINIDDMKGRSYLYYSVGSEIWLKKKQIDKAQEFLESALLAVENKLESDLILAKLEKLKSN